MTGNEKLAEVLNDLVLINNDRIEAYEKATKNKDTVSHEYESLFKRMIGQSNEYRQELIDNIKHIDPNTRGSIRPGNLYWRWMSAQYALSGKNTLSFSELCELESAVQNAYEEAHNPEVYIPADTISLIIMQKLKLRESYHLIKRKCCRELVMPV